MGCLSTQSWLGTLGPGHTQLCAFHVATLRTISGICCITDCTVVGSLPSQCIICCYLFALHLHYIGMSPSTILFLLSFVRYASITVFLYVTISNSSFLFECFLFFSSTFYFYLLNYLSTIHKIAETVEAIWPLHLHPLKLLKFVGIVPIHIYLAFQYSRELDF